LALIDTFVLLGSGAPLAAPFGREQLLKRMDELGITHAIAASSLAIASDFEAGNEWLAREIEGERRLLAWAVVNTNHPPEAIESVRKYMANRQFVGLLLIEGNDHTPVSGAEYHDILNAYRRFGKPLLISAPNRECVYAAAEIAKQFELIKVVLVGMGGQDWRSALAAARENLNIYLSTTGEISPDKVREAWPVVNGHRIMFGSGAPLVDPSVPLGMVEEAGLKDFEKTQLFSSNAERAFASA